MQLSHFKIIALKANTIISSCIIFILVISEEAMPLCVCPTPCCPPLSLSVFFN